jgi:hypothetical protein
LIDSLKKTEENYKILPKQKLGFGEGSGGIVTRDSFPHPYGREILEFEIPKTMFKQTKVNTFLI